MNIAFYAPLKSPSHDTPSGDRRMARLLMQAWTLAGYSVEIVSRFRSYDRGNPTRQARLKVVGERLADRLIRRFLAKPAARRPQAWFTYHLYHKAPDWLGPRVAKALSIPYIVAEASFAPKQAGGKWDIGHSSVQDAIGCADLILGFNPDDIDCLTPLLSAQAQHTTIAPFMDTAPYDPKHFDRNMGRQRLAKRYHIDPSLPWLLTVAMMRDDQKRQSYEVLGAALEKIKDCPWHLLIAGSGPAEVSIKAMFEPFKDRVTVLGFQDEDALRDLYACSDIFVWPAIKEAYGMVFLEAQSSGLPVVAGNSAGVASIVQHNHTGLLTPQGDVEAFADAVALLLTSTSVQSDMRIQAQAQMVEKHDLQKMAQTLHQHLQYLMMGVAV